QELKKFIGSSDILILSDEVYEHITFDGEKHESILNHPELMTRTLVCGSFGKTFHNTGWKMGYCIAPSYLMKEFQKIHQFIVFSANAPIQHALAEYLQNPENYLSLPAFYQQKRDYFLELMKDSRFKLQPAKGSYFQLADYSAISDEKDTDFVQRLTAEVGVAAIPVSAFYSNGLDEKVIRFCFAKKNETLEQAAELLCKM
ncbi:MAG: aminotransferase class I/II-fold pyridoxal phosphate-dependent enzyme, partial [Chitinophagales bacterium]